MIIASQISLVDPVALCPGFWPIAVKLSSHHDLCRFSANVPAAACMVTRLTRFIGDRDGYAQFPYPRPHCLAHQINVQI